MVYISRISLNNFKSFRRASFPIPQGFTCIVGPNGSGKSNIVDAICFVLGRSSARSLRAERFSDLIFNGGKNSKPARQAEVSIYLDNSAKEMPITTGEVKISRKVDTSGNSVYLLNNKRTTRNEILDILRIVNINPDGHNIVLQGDITQIIEVNPVERRKIIDEIAGIAEYDERKNKAIRELEKVQDNLSRARDIFKEISSQMRKLEKEKQDAQRYEYLIREIKKNRAIVLQSKYLEAKERLEELEENIGKHEKDIDRLSGYIDILSLKNKIKKEQIEKINREVIVKEETEHYELFKKVENLRSQFNLLEHEVKAVKSGLEIKISRIKEIEEKSSELFEEEDKNKAKINKLEKEKAEISLKISSLRKEIKEEYTNLTEADEKTRDKRVILAELSKELEKKNFRFTELHRKIAILRDKAEARKKASEETKVEVKDRKRKLETERESLGVFHKRIEKAGKTVSELHTKKQISQDRVINIKEKLLNISSQLDFNIKEYAKLEAEYKAAERIKKGRGNLNRAVAEILRLRDENIISGIYGTIAELGKVEKRYSKALEVAAGGGMLNIVVENDEIAKRCIEHIKKRKIGRASFLPINRLRGSGKRRETEVVAEAALGFAIDLVNFDKKFKKGFEQVFRSTVVVENLEFARQYIGRARMVTLDGDLVEESGRMTGGYYYPSSSASFEIVDEEREKIKRLASEIKNLTQERERLENNLRRASEELERLEREERSLESEIEIGREKIKVKKNEIDSIENILAKKEAELREIIAEISLTNGKIKDREPEWQKVRDDIEKLHIEKAELEEELSSSGLYSLLEEIKKKEEELRKFEMESGGAASKIEVLEAKNEEIVQKRLKEFAGEKQNLKNELVEGEAKLSEKNKELVKLESRLREEESREERIKVSVNRLKSRRDFLSKGINSISEKVDVFQESRGKVMKEMEKLKIEKARVDVNLENIISALKEFPQPEVELIVPMETEEIEREVARMGAEKKSLEPINMRAIEDYDVVKEKYDRFDMRIDRLEREKEAIEELMGEIEHRKKVVFMVVFENIAKNFRSIFSRVSGGDAELILDDEKPLEGGLRIQARPPGKNPQYIELLSGGERTLTAISFIFAIQHYQPAPFYILDEIDMFLDGYNVEKISELIKEASKDAQFIVVSFRDDMILNADQLFGISNDDGASKVLGVELEDVGV